MSRVCGVESIESAEESAMSRAVAASLATRPQARHQVDAGEKSSAPGIDLA
ncbi:MAG: hypothetical protein ACLQVF_14660 [Isosphaeraceae bacterium]